MIITKNNFVKIALSLQQKQTLLKNEKVFLKYFSIVKFLVENNNQLNLNTIDLKMVNKLKIVKTPIAISKLKAGEFFTNNFCYNVFCGNLKNVVLSKSGYVKIYENNNYKFLNLLVAGHNVFANSRVNNYPNKTIIFNKHFRLKIYTDGNKLVFSCNKTIDNFAANTFYIVLASTPVLTLSNTSLAAINLLLLNTCKQVKYAREANLSAENGAFAIGCFIYNQNSMQNYVNLASSCTLLNFLEKPILVCSISQNGFVNNLVSTQKLNVLTKVSGTNKVVLQSTFYMHFANGIFYASSLLSKAVFKLPLTLGDHKIIFTSSGLKIINITANHTFYISTTCKIKRAQILNGELVCEFFGDIKFCVANVLATWHEVSPHTQGTLIKLERLLTANPVNTLFALQNSFYELTKIDNVFYAQLKQIIKNKQSLRYASQKIIKLASTAKSETELKKLFKLSGLIGSLPERKTNLTDLELKQNITLPELEQLTTEEQLELYKIKQQNPLVKKAKIC